MTKESRDHKVRKEIPAHRESRGFRDREVNKVNGGQLAKIYICLTEGGKISAYS